MKKLNAEFQSRISKTDPEIKRVGDSILTHVRMVVRLAAGENSDKEFKLKRWIFSRLLRDEIIIKRKIKKKLWDKGMRKCQSGGEKFLSLKGVEIHRKNESRGYSASNCMLLCRECHEKIGKNRKFDNQR